MKACCANMANRVPWEQQPQAPLKLGNLLAQICLRCGCRHFTLVAEPGKVGVRL